MCIYCGTDNYRKIYEHHYGTIPKDEDGRTYEIHHIDGNHGNNEPKNLKAVTIQEHYNIHHSRGDFGACLLISRAMNLSSEEKSQLARDSAIKRIDNGTHNWLGPETNRKRVEEGTHNFLGGQIGGDASRRSVANGTHVLLGGLVQRKQVIDGKNKLVGGSVQRDSAKKLLDSGKFHSSVVRTCPHCGTSCKSNSYFRYHGDRCKKHPDKI
jgi:hypothetical protein